MFITNKKFKKSEELMFNSMARRPYYILRGKKITEEQAFDIISKEGKYLSSFDNYKEEIITHSTECINTYIGILKSKSFSWIETFIDPEGKVGTNYFTSKWPEEYEFIFEHLVYAKKYPYLSYVVIYTNFNEMDDEWPFVVAKPFNFTRMERIKQEYCYALHIHDGGVEVVSKNEAFKLYDKYMAEYSCDEIFCRDDYNNYIKSYLNEKYIDRLCDKWKVSDSLRKEIKSYNIFDVKEEIDKFYKIYSDSKFDYLYEEYEKELYKVVFELFEQIKKAVENKDYELKTINFKENQEKCYKIIYEANSQGVD